MLSEAVLKAMVCMIWRISSVFGWNSKKEEIPVQRAERVLDLHQYPADSNVSDVGNPTGI
jgi:hypothetical protein